MDAEFDREDTFIFDDDAASENINSHDLQNSDNVSETSLSALETIVEETKPYVPTHYFVDYENVRASGLTGIEYLRENDEVIVVYTANAESISWDLYSILKSRNVCPIKVPTGPQSADKHLIALLASDVGFHGNTCKYVVVSNDAGYAPILSLLHQRFNVFAQRKTILRAVAHSTPAPSFGTEADSLLFFSEPSSAPETPRIVNGACEAGFLRFVNIIRQVVSLSESDEKYVKLRECWTRFCNDGKQRTVLQLCHDTLCSALHSEGEELFRTLKDKFQNLK